MLIRINKAIASRGICSRRKAEELIAARRVSVNGQIVSDLALKIPEDAMLEIDGKPYSPCNRLIYLMMYKPIKVMCTAHDPQGRKIILDLLPPHYKELRPFSVGRLDYFSEGLLLLSNDGDFANRILHPRYAKIKKYEVIVKGDVPEIALKNMRSGMRLDGKTVCAPVGVQKTIVNNGDTLLLMELQQGLNRQIRKMCAKSGLRILKLKRISFGPFNLGNLQPGEIVEIDPKLASLTLAGNTGKNNSAKN